MADKIKQNNSENQEEEEAIDVEALVKSVSEEIDKEKEVLRRTKIRHVLNQVLTYDNQIRKHENEGKKLLEKREKAANKLAEIRKGNLKLLDAIDLSGKNNDNDNEKKE